MSGGIRDSRRTRLAAPPDASETERVIWDVSADVSAPLIALFVDWCLRESRAAGIERLYFLSRDGQVMMQVAEILGLRDSDPTDCRYLYVSRQALLLPAVGDVFQKNRHVVVGVVPRAAASPRAEQSTTRSMRSP